MGDNAMNNPFMRFWSGMEGAPQLPLAMTRMVEELQGGVYNFDRLHQMAQRAVQTMAECNQVSMDVMEEFARRQSAIMERSGEMMADAAKDIVASSTPAEAAQKQLDAARRIYDMAQSELRALVQCTIDAQAGVRKIYSEAMQDSLGLNRDGGDGAKL